MPFLCRAPKATAVEMAVLKFITCFVETVLLSPAVGMEIKNGLHLRAAYAHLLCSIECDWFIILFGKSSIFVFS